MKIYLVCPNCNCNKYEVVDLINEIACCLECGHEFEVKGTVSPIVKWRNSLSNVIKMDKKEKIVSVENDQSTHDSKNDQNEIENNGGTW
jgi:hypothetical protein